ncbi:hypothetical protein STCU_07482 [Strigomonas culicis]|uniref:Uncharacterized protein n=1 Tax=Strigomonas culicis TaxID=28005 RepID=S9U486_9TRYP|nr:hypothetical protein STCU_07482 [Strigomonas culicis]|eukprot:EPY23758.1 hypothetical protein STCU_07482 [Strigomonas culicis]
MHTDFTSVDAELQEIEADFTSGRMNAFGDMNTQESFLREMRRIAEIETQVFYRSCTLLKTSSESEYAILTSMFASAQPPPGSKAAPSGRPPPLTSTNSISFTGRGGSGGGPSSRPSSPLSRSFQRLSVTGVPNGSTFDPNTSGGVPLTEAATVNNTSNSYTLGNSGTSVGGPSFGAAAAPVGSEPKSAGDRTGRSGFDDHSFDEISEHYRMLEADFAAVGDNLRQISKHVVQLNTMSEQVNSAALDGGGDDHVLPKASSDFFSGGSPNTS